MFESSKQLVFKNRTQAYMYFVTCTKITKKIEITFKFAEIWIQMKANFTDLKCTCIIKNSFNIITYFVAFAHWGLRNCFCKICVIQSYDKIPLLGAYGHRCTHFFLGKSERKFCWHDFTFWADKLYHSPVAMSQRRIKFS